MTGYNGWRNRETWLVNVWFGDYFNDMTEDCQGIDASFIEEHVNEHVEALIGAGASFVADLIDLGCIDYDELAAHYMADFAEEEEEDA